MRLESITLSNFRGFAERQTIPLDGDVVVVWGPNGAGKTSLFDALEWLFAGHVPRLAAASLRASEDPVASRYVTGAPFVSVVLRDEDGLWTANRTGGEGTKSRLTVTAPNGVVREHDDAEGFVRELVGHEDISLRTFLLHQDALTELVSGDTRERYKFLAELTGLDGLRGMDEQLRSELRRLRSGLKDRQQELETQRQSVLSAEKEFQETRALMERQTAERQERVVQAVEPLARVFETDPLNVSAIGARTRDVIAEAKTLLLVMGGAEDLVRREGALGDEARALEAQRADLSGTVRSIDAREAEIRPSIEALREAIAVEEQRRSDLQQLAALALEHLGPPCPVCGQEHDIDETRTRLRALLDASDSVEEVRATLRDLEARATSFHNERIKAEAELESLRARALSVETEQRAVVDAQTTVASARDSLQDLLRVQVPIADAATLVTERISELEVLLARLEAARSELDRLGALETRAQASRVDLVARRGRLDATEREVEDLGSRVARAQAVCRWVGNQSQTISAEIMNRSAPLADALFRRFDVHPTFRRFAFQAERVREAGHLRPWVFDDAGHQDGNAVQVLSAGQLNALAVSLFLALNLEEQSRFEVALLDDPVQNMDDLNVLSLIDVMRALRSRRQLILTTHDIVLAQLLQTKLRPLDEHQQTLLIKLSRWTPRGPMVDIERGEWEPGTAAYQLVSGRGANDRLDSY
jgi:DNA repair exonuclease SbcCD ATPase subunit